MNTAIMSLHWSLCLIVTSEKIHQCWIVLIKDGHCGDCATLIVMFALPPLPEWNMNDNVKRLINRARTLSKLRSGEEKYYEEEWAGIGHMVSAEAFEFGLHAGGMIQEGSCD